MYTLKRLGGLVTLFLLLVHLFAAVGPCPADIYKWKDEKGHWHFSDSPTSDVKIEDPPIAEHRSDQSGPETSAPALDQTAGSAALPAPAEKRGAEPFAAGTSSAQGGLLWRIERQGLRPSHLLGTIHSSDPRVVRLKPAVAQALDQSDRFVMEMEMDASILTALGAEMMLAGDKDLADLLGRDLFAQAAAAMADFGLPEPAVRRFKPWAVMALLSMPKPTAAPVLDLVLHQRAQGAGKPTAGLETMQEQVAVFEGMSMADQITLLKMTLADLPQLPTFFEQLLQAYVSDDLGQIARLAAKYNSRDQTETTQRFMLRINDQRNARMVRRMQSHLARGNSFIAVGALHLSGPTGLIDLLRAEGYQVIPVTR
ncbi:MAG: DUF4124 domain-containing protein [Desulfatitalea sp.]|nr:TraB/GumN family protein [Desulfatitalea sp.]NNK02582.1 DUF4124 domain-containing protein [Desulfatitalea sp.]